MDWDIVFKKFSSLLIVALVISVSSCEDDECLKGSGDSSSETRTFTEEFTAIEVNNNLNVDIYIDGSNFLEVIGGKNVIPHIKSYMAENTLKLENKNSCTFLRGFDQDTKLKLHIKSLASISYKGSGKVIMKDTANVEQFSVVADGGTGSIKLMVNCKKMTVSLRGGLTDIELIGSAELSSIYLSESGWVVSKDFKTERSDIYNESTGDCIVNADSVLYVSIIRSGNIQYLGNPDIHYNKVTGEGLVKPYSP